MSLLDREPISSPYNVSDRLKLVSDQHIIKVNMIEAVPESLLPPKPAVLYAIRQALGPLVTDIETIWGKAFFAGWAFDLRTPGRSPGLYVESGGSVEILDGHFIVSVFLPSRRFSSKPNRSGRISSDEEIEAPLKGALDAATYLIVRFLTGFLFGLNEGRRDECELSAIQFLHPYYERVTPLFFHDSSETKSDLQKDEILQKLITESKLRGAQQVRLLWGQQMGDLQFESGRNVAAHVGRNAIAMCPLFLPMANTIRILIDMRLESRATHLGQRGIRKAIGTHTDPSFEVAYANLSLPIDHSTAVVRSRSRTASFEEFVLLAREYDVDLTDIFAELRYLQPLVAAWRAVGRYERLHVFPDPETDDGLLALYGLRALKDLLGPERAQAGPVAMIIEQIAPAEDAILLRLPLHFPEP
jgi:hypothetical protein